MIILLLLLFLLLLFYFYVFCLFVHILNARRSERGHKRTCETRRERTIEIKKKKTHDKDSCNLLAQNPARAQLALYSNIARRPLTLQPKPRQGRPTRSSGDLSASETRRWGMAHARARVLSTWVVLPQ